MVELQTEYPSRTLRDHLRGGVAILTRAHPIFILSAVAAGFVMAPILVAALAHPKTAIVQLHDPIAGVKDDHHTTIAGTTATTDPQVTPPLAPAPAPDTDKSASQSDLPAFAESTGSNNWSPSTPAPTPQVTPKAALRLQQEPMQHAVRHRPPQQQARERPTSTYHAQSRAPAYSGRSTGGNQQSMRPRPYPNNFNRNGWGNNQGRNRFGGGGGRGGFHGGRGR